MAADVLLRGPEAAIREWERRGYDLLAAAYSAGTRALTRPAWLTVAVLSP